MDEAEIDRQHMLKGMYPGMKILHAKSTYLNGKYPGFPSFWQDLSSWTHLDAMKRVYLVACERREEGMPEEEINVEEIDKKLIATSTVNGGEDSEAVGEVGEMKGKKGR